MLGPGRLLTNLFLVLGCPATSSTDAATVRLAGVAGLLAGAFWMAAGGCGLGLRAQQELVEREVEVERQELARKPEAELRELTGMYRAQGLTPEDADTVARIRRRTPRWPWTRTPASAGY